MSPWAPRPGPAAAAGVVVGTAVGAAWAARAGLAAQAAAARRTIGKPLGEEALEADRTWKPSYGDPVDLLLLGDSIAAGLGARRRRETLGSQLGKRLAKALHRSVRVTTAARVGAETSQLRTQLTGLPPGYRADVAVIVVGGNDVTHRVPTKASAEQLAEAVDVLRADGTEVVVGTCPDLAALTAVPQPLRTLGSVASRRLAEAQRRTALEHGARVVSLATVVGPFFAAQPDTMFAEDRFHPSPEGYRRTAKALLPSVLAALGHVDAVPFGHAAPVVAPTPPPDVMRSGRPDDHLA